MNELIKNPPNADEEVHLLDYIIVLAKYSRMIIYTSAIMSILTLGYLLTQPNQYTATATILPPQQNSTLSAHVLDSLGISSNPASAVGGFGRMSAILGLKSPGDLYVGMLKGLTISDRIIARFNLREVYEQKYIEGTRRQLAARTDIKAGKEGLITISATDESPQKAAEMANAFVEELDKLQQEMSINDARNQFAFLEKERVQASLNLTRAEEELRTFSESSSIVQIDTQAKGVIEYITQLRAAIDAKEVQIQVVRQSATPSNYDLIRLETELAGLKEKLRAAEINAEKKCEGDICITAGKMPNLGLEYFRLYREVKYQEALYQMFSKMVELARMDAARNTVVSTVHFVDRAKPPDLKSKPKRLLTSILVGIITFIIMVFVAFGREYWQKASQMESARLHELSSCLQPWRQKVNRILSFLRIKR
ncbi:GumC family protein [Desulfobacca acetoxidans]|uniref:Lipopolysaccharide biosynthesis protein n=1 Tax=Desulfobacca acetoxidans (strain ATCC 700848 / DSM 11109 / ASRB2) TaxID=880072 RepID=F2NIJ4_DESAR|nr:GNVR domain-containing protein [Desulfobacca acetoxidans]AEB10469.1 lipopolysaccharide biosynthesis protein [Desulfobacca acetoxidans DSM 11109]